MNLDIKTVAVFLPFLAACCIGVTYVMSKQVITVVSLPTYIFLYCIAGAGMMALLHLVSPMKIDFSQLAGMPIAAYAAIAIVTSLAAWLMGLVAIREISPTYAAIGEISYPFFTALFAYLIFRSRELDWSMAVGGLLILAGSIIVMTDRFRGG